ncbi:hypothetical protein HaLaN_32099, partial [Haematococcus lacustris]
MSGVFINISTTTIATTDFTGNAYLATIPIGAQLLGAAACLESGEAVGGPSFAVANGFRFVAAEFFTGCGYTAAWRARAISLSVGMAVFAAGIGPEAVRHVRYALDKPYAGGAIAVIATDT